MVLREKMLPCQSREAMVTVLSYHNGIMDGYLQHPRLGEKEKVESLSQMILLLNSLLDVGETIPYRAEDPAPWGAEAAYQRFRDGEPTGDWLVCWPGRILDLYLEAPDLEEAQIARAAARLAPENGEEEAP